jgi:SP family arabinose:H+ symporter-like MFS transporter
LIAWSFHTGSGSFIVYYVFLFIAAHAVGQGAVIWVFISEIFPNSVRAAGTSFGSLTHWAWATIITLVFPSFAGNPDIGGAKIFAFFAVMMVLQLLYVWKMMPETKGNSPRGYG